MSAEKEERTVRVYVEDNGKAESNIVTKEDIVDWLSLLDKLSEVKLQYDTNAKQMCYQVCFAHSTAAKEAVQYLNGAKLKNCKVTITSLIYKQPECDSSSNNDDGTNGMMENETSKSKIQDEWEVESLPHNHLIPVDIRMDAALAHYLPMISLSDSDHNDNNNINNNTNITFTDNFIGASSLYNLLRELQQQLHEELKELESLRNQVYHLDNKNEANNILQEEGNSNSNNSNKNEKTSNLNSITKETDITLANNIITFGNTNGILLTAHPPIHIVNFLTQNFGIVSRCASVLLPGTSNEYLLRVAFMMNEDACEFAHFLTLLNNSISNNNSSINNTLLTNDEVYNEMKSLFRESAWQELPVEAWNWDALRIFQIGNVANIGVSHNNNNNSNNFSVASAACNPVHEKIASLLNGSL